MQTLQQLQNRISELEAQLVHYKRKFERDALTGCMRREAFVEKLQDLNPDLEWSVVVIDIDHFKRINDAFGHATGDRVLSQLGQKLQDALPPQGLCARWGGEEFVAVIPLNSESSRFWAETLRRAVAQSDSEVPYTLSAGLHRLPNANTFDQALESADSKLYRAKAQGRNQVAA